MQLTIVGCAGSFPGPDSPASCYLIDTGDFRLVLDLGSGALGVLQRYIPLSGVDAICVSHLHTDHCIDLIGYSVFQLKHPDGPRPRIPVFGPPGTSGRLAQARGSDPAAMTGAFDFTDLEPGTIQIGPLRLTLARMRHSVETFGFRIEHAGQVLAYSADTAPCEELVTLARGADVLLAEASLLTGHGSPPGLHLTAREAAEHAAAADVGELVLTHLVAWNDRAVTQEQAAVAYDGPLRLASTGLRLLGPAGPGRHQEPGA